MDEEVVWIGGAYGTVLQTRPQTWAIAARFWRPLKHQTTWCDKMGVVSASNDGELGRESIGSPATAKNVVTVGSLGSDLLPATIVSSYSSRGPTPDGRIKPDVVAPGEWLTSASSSQAAGQASCELTAMAGTSMSAPWPFCVRYVFKVLCCIVICFFGA